MRLTSKATAIVGWWEVARPDKFWFDGIVGFQPLFSEMARLAIVSR